MTRVFIALLLLLSQVASAGSYWTLPDEMRGNSEFTGNITVPATGLLFKTNGTLIKSGTGALTLATGTDSSTVTKSGTGGLTLATGANAVSMTWGAASTLTMPTGTVTVAALQTAQTFTAAQTFSINSTSPALLITQTGTGHALVVEDSTTPDASPFIIDATGNVIIGDETQITPTGFSPSQLQIAGTTTAVGALFHRANDSADTSNLWFAKSRGSLASPTAVQNGDIIGAIRFAGYDGANWIRTAQIFSDVAGTPGTADMPGRFVIGVTASGAATPTNVIEVTATSVDLKKATTFTGGFAAQTIAGAVAWSSAGAFTGTRASVPAGRYLSTGYQAAGVGEVIAWGPDTSTNGSLSIFSTRSNGSSTFSWMDLTPTAATINVPVTLASGGTLSAGKQISIPDWGGAAQATAVGLVGQKTGINSSSSGNINIISNGWSDGSAYRAGTNNTFTCVLYMEGGTASLSSTALNLYSTQTSAGVSANDNIGATLKSLFSVTHAGAVTLGPASGLTASHLIQSSATGSTGYALSVVNNVASGSASAGLKVQAGANNSATDIVLALINNDAATSPLVVYGNGSVFVRTTNWGTGGTAIGVSSSLLTTSPSSRRYKENEKPLTVDSSKIYDIEVKEFDYIQAKGGAHDFGPIAEDVEEVLPEIVWKEEGQIESIRESKMVWLLLEEMKKLNARIAVLEQSK